MTSFHVMLRDHYDADNDGVVDESGASPLSDDSPAALGTATAGTGSSAARADHVHAMPNRARGAYDAIVYIQDGEVIAEDATGTEIDSGVAGTDDYTILAAVAATGGKILLDGDFLTTSDGNNLIVPAENTEICGMGRGLTSIKNMYFRLNNAHQYIHDLTVWGIDINAYACYVRNSDVRLRDIYIGPLVVGGVSIYADLDHQTLTDIFFDNVVVYRPSGFGFMTTGLGSPTLRRVMYNHCEVYDAGIYNNSNIWACGIDFADLHTITVDDVEAHNCVVDGAYESAYHSEVAPSHNGLRLFNCRAENAGQKPDAYYGAGFCVPMGDGGITTLVGCTAESCFVGFRVFYNYGTLGAALIGCTDVGSATGFRIGPTSGPVFLDDCMSISATSQSLLCRDASGVHVKNFRSISPAGDSNGFGVGIGYLNDVVTDSDFDIHAYGGSLVQIYSGYADNVRFSGSVTHQGGTGGETGIYLAHTTNCIIDGLVANIHGSYGVRVGGNTANTMIQNVVLQTNQDYNLINGIYATTTRPTVDRATIKNMGDVTNLFAGVDFLNNSGSSTGTGSEQTIAHGLVAAPSKVAIVPTETGATVSSWWADATNIYATVTSGKAFNWSAEV